MPSVDLDANVDLDLCRHMASLGHNELKMILKENPILQQFPVLWILQQHCDDFGEFSRTSYGIHVLKKNHLSITCISVVQLFWSCFYRAWQDHHGHSLYFLHSYQIIDLLFPSSWASCHLYDTPCHVDYDTSWWIHDISIEGYIPWYPIKRGI